MSIPDVDQFHLQPIPKTAYHKNLKESSIHPIEPWLQDFTRRNADKYENILSRETHE